MSASLAAPARDRLRIAIQKSGRLAEPARAVLAACGLSWRESRDKLFFFVSYESTRDKQNVNNTISVPTEALRRGDLSVRLPFTDGVSGKIDLKNLPAITIARSDAIRIGDVALAVPALRAVLSGFAAVSGCSVRPCPASNANSVTLPPLFRASTRLAIPCSVGVTSD